jgi:hypothetical protein
MQIEESGKCGYAPCKCAADRMTGYCSSYCEDAGAASGDMVGVCRCGHAGCDTTAAVGAEQLAAT